MTRSEFLKSVSEGTINDEVKDYAKTRYEKLTAERESVIENHKEIDKQVSDYMNSHPEGCFAREIAVSCGCTTGKIVASLKRLGIPGIEKTENKKTAKFYKI